MKTTLYDVLWNLRNEDLAFRTDLLGIKPKPARKAELIDGIKNALSGEGLEVIWNSLNDLERAAVAEACYVPALLESSLKLSVYASLRIQVLVGDPCPGEKLLLDTWAENIEPGVWQLDSTRALKAVERGQKAADFMAFLEQHDSQPLPDTVLSLLQTSESDGRAVKICGDAQIFEIRDAATADLICAQSELQGKCLRCGEAALAVLESDLPTFRKVSRALSRLRLTSR